MTRTIDFASAKHQAVMRINTMGLFRAFATLAISTLVFCGRAPFKTFVAGLIGTAMFAVMGLMTSLFASEGSEGTSTAAPAHG